MTILKIQVGIIEIVSLGIFEERLIYLRFVHHILIFILYFLFMSLNQVPLPINMYGILGTRFKEFKKYWSIFIMRITRELISGQNNEYHRRFQRVTT